MRGPRRERLRVESRVHDTNLRSVGEQNRGQMGPTSLFECPAQTPRSFLRSFSRWALHPTGTSAERTVRLGAAEFFPRARRQAGRVRKRRREGNLRRNTEGPKIVNTISQTVEWEEWQCDLGGKVRTVRTTFPLRS